MSRSSLFVLSAVLAGCASSSPRLAPAAAQPPSAEVEEAESAARSEIQFCGRPSGATRARVIFASSGRVLAAGLADEQRARSPSGACALRVLLDMRVLPFRGAPLERVFDVAMLEPAPPSIPDPPSAPGEKPFGRLAPEVIQRVVRSSFGLFRHCYEDGLRRDPTLRGRVSVQFVIGRDGRAGAVEPADSDLPDVRARVCVREQFKALAFPAPAAGIVTVTYPIMFEPGGSGQAPPKAEPRGGQGAGAPQPGS